MKIFVNIVAIILIVFGIISLTYNGYTYTTQEKVAEIGALKVTAETEKTVPLSPILGGICIALGLGLIIFNRIKR
jgi:uncharacterized membrane protein